MPELYVVHRAEPGAVSPAGGLTATMERVKDRAGKTRPGPWEIFERGQRSRARRADLKDALEVKRKKLDAAEIGDVIVLKSAQGRIETRKILEDVELPSQASLWPPDQREVYSYLFGKYGNKLRWGGTCNCRATRQGGSLSDHACCRALDIFPVTKAIGDEIFKDLMKPENRKRFGIRYIAWQVALHYDHLHIATGEKCSGCF